MKQTKRMLVLYGHCTRYCFLSFSSFLQVFFFLKYYLFVQFVPLCYYCYHIISVPKYEVILPFQADETGQFITHALHRRSRRKRSTGQQQFWFYSVNAFGSSLHLNVTKAKNILSPGSIVETTHENGSISYSTPPKNTFYRGHVVSQPGSAVAINNLNGLV